MAKSAFEARIALSARTAPPLSPSVRRKLGASLRSFYADAMSEPVSERLEALIAKLENRKD